MAKFLSGPPGGRTLPLATPRLSDLDGGVYGPGASAASTGINAGRAVIKTANARAAGETWEDLLEYYLVRIISLYRYHIIDIHCSSMQIAEKLTLLIVWARYSIKVASMVPLVALLQVETVPVLFLATTIVPDTTSFVLLVKSGHQILRIHVIALKMISPLKPVTLHSPQATLGECI